MLSGERKKELERIFNEEDEGPLELSQEEQEFWDELVFQGIRKALAPLWQNMRADNNQIGE